MTRVLIVDDEPFIVDGLKMSVNWEQVGVTDVWTAYNARQAREKFDAGAIDIMLCDIEMPEESGLDLLAWVKRHHPATESVFLTCHADFSFARQAIELGSSDYLLKPVPQDKLEAVIRKLIDKIRKQHELAEQSQSWVQHHPLFMDRFWLDLIHHVIPPNPPSVQKAIQERKIPVQADTPVKPVLIHVQRWHKELPLRDEKILEYALRNAAEEMFKEIGATAKVVPFEHRKLLAVIEAEPRSEIRVDQLRGLCESYIRSCHRYFYCDISCYIGEAVPVYGIAERTKQLLSLQSDNVAYSNHVFLPNAESRDQADVAMPDMKVWSVMLAGGSGRELIAEAERYLNALVNHAGVNARALVQFHQNYLQLLYVYLQSKNIEARQLFQDATSSQLSEQAVHSIPDMIDWIRHVTLKAIDQAQKTEQSQSIVDKARRYIDRHLDSDISRETLASQFYLNPDYMDRLFKKETGMSMKEYLWQERLRVAEELLASTELPVTDIAMQVGYSSLSAFTRLFKKRTGFNPSDYRWRHRLDRSK